MTVLYRADGLLDLERVEKQKLVFVGLGSLGSLTLGNLMYPWREIVLIDPEVLEIDNVERHLLSPRFVGKPKVEGVRQTLVEWGIPENRIIAHHGVAQDILFQHADADLAIVTVDNRGAKSYVDGWARAHNVPTLTGGVYPMGNGGHVVVLPSPAEVCYGCAAHALNEDEYAGKTNDDYGLNIAQLLDGDGNIHKVPSLKAPVSTIAADVANYAIRLLEGGQFGPHVYYHSLGWETFLTLNMGGVDTQAVMNYIIQHAKLGIAPHMKLEMQDGRLNLNVLNGTLPVQISRWENCPNHSTTNVSLDDI
jgi:hypothetical protein